MLFQIKSYLNFLIKSNNQHGIHSPFVYNLITGCFYDTSPKKWYQKFDEYKASLLNNKNKIFIEDLGAGSRSLQKNERQISKIASNAGISNKRARLLGRIANYFDAQNILEIGTSLGIATSSLRLANPEAKITTLEGCKNTANIAKESFEKFNFQHIDVIIGDFSKTLPEVLNNNIYDLIFFDGNHQKEPTIHYFEQCLHHIHNDSVFIFDDIYWSKGMHEAWQYIIEHPKVTISIDTFNWGIVFFRKEQPKQHFTIRV